MLVILLLIPA
jgi:NADH-quinone oxidoreductase subunit M